MILNSLTKKNFIVNANKERIKSAYLIIRLMEIQKNIENAWVLKEKLKQIQLKTTHEK